MRESTLQDGSSALLFLQGFLVGAGLVIEGDETIEDLSEAMVYVTESRARR